MSDRARRLKELALLFLRLGTTAFGGPAAHIAMMQDEVVRRRGWMSSEELLDLVGATNLIPGPNSTELAIHIGRLRAGVPGLLVAGAAFILPAALITSALGWGYLHYGALPAVGGVLYATKPVIIAIVLAALVKLGRTAVKSAFLGALGVLALAAALLGVDELGILLVAAGASAIAWRSRMRAPPAAAALAPLALSWPAAAGAATAAAPFSLGALFLFFLKIGSILFGSGYVLLAFLRADLVVHWHWLSESQLLDAALVGQVTPGPVFTTATFIGFILGGPAGALLATLAIFLPAFVLVALSGPLVPRLRRSPTAGAFLDGLNVGSLALMAAVTAQLGRAALIDWPTVALAAASAFLLFCFPRISSAWWMLLAALVGLAGSWW